ncbi:YozE family protein [Variovorax sp. GB1P17]|uniref:YozE family protein n=1 Tax=Variovorax sp. GB1P17 TaxID=3443740 RepID=UPI003F47CA05
MATTLTAARLEQLKREAKKLTRATSVSHAEALDRLAVENGFANWSLLAKHVSRSSPVSPTPALPPLAPPPAPKPSMPARYYLHGDEEEGASGKFYCSQCDLFVDGGHFFSKHPREETLEHCLAAVERWGRRPASETVHRRPHGAHNMLEQAARAFTAAREAARGPFHHWLEQRKDRDTIVGDIARDALRDKTFPVGATTLDELLSHLDRKSAPHAASQALREAWKQFQTSLRRVQRTRPGNNALVE